MHANSIIIFSAVVSDTRTQPCWPPQTRPPVCSPPSLVKTPIAKLQPPVCSPPKTPIAKLQEHCQQNYLPLPAYKELQVAGGFRWIVIIHDKQYCGEIKSNKQDAKHSAAEVALQQLDSSSEFVCFLPYNYLLLVQIWPIVVQ